MAVAHIMGMGGSMANPFEYREIMKAQFQLNSDKTVDTVLAEQEQRHKERARPTRGRRSSSPAPTGGAPSMSEMAKLQQLLKRPTTEGTAPD